MMNRNDVKFLREMIRHHQDALAMARDAMANGMDPMVKKMAREMYEVQSKEVVSMKRMLGEKA